MSPPPLRRASYDSEILKSLPRRIPFTNTRSLSLSAGPSTALLVKTSQLASAQISSPRPSLHAIIIACNTYPSPELHHLRGAEPDAHLFRAYLMDDLQVSEEQITCLLGAQALRSSIIQAFQDLATNENINNGDPIVIYFAGHGTEISYMDGSTFQAIIPHDYCEGSIYVIPDHVLGRLIEEIAKVKGNNITVIFDCCSAGSGTRGLKGGNAINDTDILARSAVLGKGAYNPEVDRDIIYNGSRSSKFCTKFRHGGLNSHIFIGACGASERAIESNGRGRFSTAFFKLLRTISPEKLRYCDILTHMDHVPDQNPQCEGVNINSYIFDGKVLPRRLQFHRIVEMRPKGGSKRHILNAGSAHGITIGAKFAIYPNNRENGAAPAFATVKSVEAFTAVLHILHDTIVSSSSIAVQTRARHREILGQNEGLRLFVPPQDEFHDMYRTLCERGSYNSHNFGDIAFVDVLGRAHLEVSWKNSWVNFSVVDSMATCHGFKQQYEVHADLNLVAIVLRKAVHFYRELNRTNNNASLDGSIDVNFFQLQEDGFDELGAPNIIPMWPDLCTNMTIEFFVDEDAPYGIRIGNNSEHDFYVYLYFFDVGALSIRELTPFRRAGCNEELKAPLIETYLEASTSPYYRDPQLKQGSYCTIGYGSAGVQPLSYYFRHTEQDVDVGFLKLILSTKAIDLSGIPQESPFVGTRSSLPWSDPYEDFFFAPRGLPHIWHTMVIPVIQRRRHATATPNDPNLIEPTL